MREYILFSFQLIREDQLCAVKWPKDRHFYRARIMEAEDPIHFKLEYIDYGTQCLHQRKEMFQLLPEFQPEAGVWPRLAIKAKLAGVKPVGNVWGKESCEAFQQMIGDDPSEVDVRIKIVKTKGDIKGGFENT